jgi:REP element-mobilizing transposase RayT
MRTALHRFYGQGDLHFITFSCYARRPYLGSPNTRNKFLQILDEVRSRHGLQLLGYVVMPEHVHLVISEPQTGDPSTSMQMLKQTVSRQVKLGTKYRRREHRARIPREMTSKLSGSAAFTILTSGAARNCRRSWTTCTGILFSANSSTIPQTGPGAVGRTMKKGSAA